MEARRAPNDLLLQLPWLPVSIGGCQLLAKSWFGDTAYHILLTDVDCVWEERMDAADIQRRAQELNRRLRAPVKAFFSHLCEVVRPCLAGSDTHGGGGEADVSLTRQEDGNISMKLKSELAGLPFYWEFLCAPSNVTVACVQLVRPLLVMSRLLQRQVEQLAALLGRKDAEIQDYRENGAALSRERLQTDAFEERTYREDFLSKTLPVLCDEQRGALGLHADLQQLYAAVVAYGNTRKRKLSEEEEEKEEEPDAPPSSSGASVVISEGDEGGEGGEGGEVDAAGAKMADTEQQKQQAAAVRSNATVPSNATVGSNAAERPSSKPKKKKVGLFR